MEEGSKDPRTVFIKGVSFDWDNSDFEKAFSDVGPVRKCFLLKGAGKNHKGCGFVTFALPEDAERAIRDFNGKSLGGRTVEAAQRRAPFAERKEKKRKRTEDGVSTASATDAAPGAVGSPALPADGETPGAPEKAAARRKGPGAAARAAAATTATTGGTAANGAAPLAGTGPAQQRPAKRQRKGVVSEGAREKQALVRTVALGNLSPAVRAQAVAYARSVGQVEEVREPDQALLARLMLQRDGCAGDVVFLVYSSVKDALAGVAALHNHVLLPPAAAPKQAGKGKAGAGQAAGAAGTLLWARQVAGEGAHLKKWRLIVRNLPFDVKEAQLRELLSPAGFVWELTVLRSLDGKARGFGFAGFMCRAHAEKAIKLANGKVVGGRPVAIDWALPKAQFVTSAAEAPEGAAEGAAAEEGAGDSHGSSGEEGASDEGGDEGAAAEVTAGEAADSLANLDQERALLKSVLAELEGAEDGDGAAEAPAQAGKGQKQRGKEPDAAQGGPQTGADNQKARLQKQELAATASIVHEAGDAEAGEDGGDGGEPGDLQTEAAKPGLAVQPPTGGTAAAAHPAQVDTTVFVRGLPLDILQYELQERLARFGKLRACRLVTDKGTRRLKGTAFAEYERREDAERAAAACAQARRGVPSPQRPPLPLHVAMLPAGQGPQVLVRGRPVEVDLALTQQDARELAADRPPRGGVGGGGGAAAAGGADKRNLYLLKEGLIEEGTPAWEAMSGADRAKRKRAAGEARTKLRSPNFFLSRTRLCLRNLPAALSERALKELVVAAVKERAAKANPVVHQVKILKDAAKPGADAAAAAAAKSPKGKGFAFVELTEHEHALCALRQLNNNPVPFGKERRPIVEFAIENAQTLKKRAARRPRQQPVVGGELAQQPDAGAANKPGQAAGRTAAAADPPKKRAARRPKQAPVGERAQQPDAGAANGPGQAGGGTAAAQADPPAMLPAAEGQPQAAPAASRKQKGKRKRAERAAERRAAHAGVAEAARGQAGASASGPDGERVASPRPGRQPKRVKRAKPGAGSQAGEPGSAAAGDAQRTPQRQQQRQDAGGKGLDTSRKVSGVRGASGSQDRQKRGQPSKPAGEVKQAAPSKGNASKRRKTEGERGDKLDGLVAMYKQQLFGDAKGKQEAAKSSMQRWYD